MCADLTHNNFVTAHHEVGHLYYAMLYWDLPMQFREGANPAFHEAVGDTLSLSVQVPQHLQDIGLLDDVSTTKGDFYQPSKLLQFCDHSIELSGYIITT